MRRRLFVRATVTVVILISLAAAARCDVRLVRIGYLTGGALATRTAWLDAFRDGMREARYEEGRSYVLTAVGADGRFEQLPALAEQLLRSHPDILLASTTPGALAAMHATTTVPIVVVSVGDPLGAGLVTDLARPGGNVTGISNGTVELSGKRLEILKDLLPGATRVAVMVNPDDPIAAPQLREAEAAAFSLGIALGPVLPVRSKGDLEPAFEAAVQAGTRAILRLVDPLNAVLRSETARLSVAHRLPVVHAFRDDAQAGGFAAYGTSQAAMYRRAASYVDRILRGTPPGDLPVERPTVFELVINLRTAKALGIDIPPAALIRADELIE